MAQSKATASDRFNDTLRSLDDQVQDLRDRLDDRRKRFEKRASKFRADVEKQLRKSPIYRRAERVRKEIEEQVEQTRTQIYDAFGIASKSEIDKLNRKLNTISKKLTELSKEQGERPAHPAA